MKWLLLILVMALIGCSHDKESSSVQRPQFNIRSTDVVTAAVNTVTAPDRKEEIARPINPEAMGIEPQLSPTPEEYEKLQQKAYEAFGVIIGEPLPDTFLTEGPTTGWFTKGGELKQLRAGAKIPRQEFRRRFSIQGWREIPLPDEYYESMHLPRGVPKNYMTCYVGQVKAKPAYLFWSDDEEVAMLVLDY